jgi:zinc protease
LLAQEDLAAAYLATDIIGMMGIGDFSRIDLEKALTGKTVDLNANIYGFSEAVSGSSSVKDFETLLQLLYLMFTAPREDETAYQTMMNMLNAQLANKDKNHKAIFRDSVTMMVNDHSERVTLLTTEMLKQVSLEKVMKVYRERFANPADFMFVFVGNIDPNDPNTQKALAQWLGSLKTTKKREQIHDHNIRVPKGEVKNYFTREMKVNTATNRIQYTS